jgi:hypothetical protein
VWWGEVRGYSRTPIPDSQYFELEFSRQKIAVGSAEQVDTIKAIHQDIMSSSMEAEVVVRFRAARDRYIRLVKELDRLIDIRVLQRTFEAGSCEVCEAWGGL